MKVNRNTVIFLQMTEAPVSGSFFIWKIFTGQDGWKSLIHGISSFS
jgi:hypothetical protein